jgi:predicted nucleic acid-binding protein
LIRTESEESYILDTSACLAFLEDEEGADTVDDILLTKKCLLPSVVLLEVYYITFRKKGEEIADKRYAMLKSLSAEFLWEIDESIVITAGRFKGQYRLSLADAIIAAFTKREGAVLVHKDPEFDLLKKEVSQLALPRK